MECPPSFFFQNPYWKYYDRLSGLTDRLSLFNRIGRHVAPVLVYYPIESLWMDSTGGKGQKSFPWQHTTVGNKGAQATINGFGDLVDGLFNNLWDLDIADGKALEKAKVVRTEDGVRLAVGPETYRVLVFPPVRAIAPSALAATDFAKAGGTVIWTGRRPETCWPAVTGEPQRAFEKTAMTFLAQPRDVVKRLPEIVAREIAVESGDAKGLLIQHRKTPSADLYLCFNDSDRALDCRLALPHGQTPSGEWLRLETETGKIESISEAQISVSLVLAPHASAVLLCTSRVGSSLPRHRPVGELQPTLQLDGPWTIQIVGDTLDETWNLTPGNTTVELPAFRHRAREFRPVSGWEQRDYDDSTWEQIYTVRDGAMFVHASPVLLRGVLPPGAKAIETPLPVTGEYVLYVNGVELDEHLGLPAQPGRIDLSKATTGLGDMAAFETTSHSGPAGLQSPLRVVCGPVQVERLEPWSKWNLPWYCGRVLYRTEIEVLDSGPAQRWFLDLGEVQHYAEVWLNGKLVGTLLWPPYRIELTQHLRKEKNELVLVVSNSLANRFAWDVWGTHGAGKAEPSGLLGPVKLLTMPGTRTPRANPKRTREMWHKHPACETVWHRHPADDSWAGSPCHREEPASRFAVTFAARGRSLRRGRHRQLPASRRHAPETAESIFKLRQKGRRRQASPGGGKTLLARGGNELLGRPRGKVLVVGGTVRARLDFEDHRIGDQGEDRVPDAGADVASEDAPVDVDQEKAVVLGRAVV